MENSQFDSKSTSSGQRTKLHVSNLPENCSRRQLTEFFNQYGQVLECSILWDSYAFIHYASLNEARNALKQASCTTFLGKRLTIQISTSRNRQTSDWYQQEAMKSMLNKSNDFLASLALVETKLHVTNLPDNCNQHELKSLFEQYGQVLECVIMWNHYAFVHFADFKEAQSAMKKLNGYEFHGRSLIIQFSTSHNRPLPKCQALNKSNASTNSSDIKASSKSTLDLTDTKDSSSKDWIKIIKAGALPVLNSLDNREKMIPLQKSLLFTDNSNMSTLKPKQENISLDCVPTPPLPKPFQNVSARMSNTLDPISRSEPIAIQNDINIRSSFSLSENCKFEEDEFGMLCNLNLISMLKRCSVQSESAMFSHVSPAYSVDSGIELGQPSYDIDYLNSLCMYEENKILKSSSENSDMDAMPTSTNYILFPSLKEEHFSSKLEYDHAILQLLKKAYSN